jgi:hypothetical protein
MLALNAPIILGKADIEALWATRLQQIESVQLTDKVREIVGLYLSPPNRALVLSVDQKSDPRQDLAGRDQTSRGFGSCPACPWEPSCRRAPGPSCPTSSGP